MLKLLRTDSANPDFVELVKYLDADLRVRDGEDHGFFAQFNKIDKIKYVVLAFLNEKAVGCGAIKEYEPGVIEVKRMYVAPENRENGIATQILKELEKWARELSYSKCILETGEKQPEAVQLYKKNAYKVIPNYGQYENVLSSVCFEKLIA
ncbi:GNAT family N-acetyltransferase [Adhaeribacter aquaticus]|uniref:GNAT family N-acetyltransferase n=1 Tax=Adhaeribacter aquaticus TaxID=299567 RepID=UPI000412B89C|nr:GNAT family N-acetyltransferase [Adhaeribacter aquaticus]